MLPHLNLQTCIMISQLRIVNCYHKQISTNTVAIFKNIISEHPHIISFQVGLENGKRLC